MIVSSMPIGLADPGGTMALPVTCAAPPGEAGRTKVPVGAGSDAAGWGRLDPVVATLARWADEDPAAMRRLLRDAELRGQFAAALDDVAVAPSAADDPAATALA